MNRRELLKSLLSGGAVLAGVAAVPAAAKVFLPPREGWPILTRGWTFNADTLPLSSKTRWDALIDAYIHTMPPAGCGYVVDRDLRIMQMVERWQTQEGNWIVQSNPLVLRKVRARW